MLKVAILFSGRGSNALSLKKIYQDHYGKSPLLITHNKKSPLASKAKLIEYDEDFEKKLLCELIDNKIDWLFLAGFMKILSPDFILNFASYHQGKNQIVNIHPSYLPDLKGLRAYERAYESNREKTGISLHYVSPELDSGEIIYQEEIPIERDLGLEDWIDKAKKKEHKIYCRFLVDVLSEKIKTNVFQDKESDAAL